MKLFNLTSQNAQLCELTTSELVAVEGGKTVKLFDITVAGMQIVGAANLDNGSYATWVKGGNTLVVQGGKV
jgi:hypothetical protein